MRLTLSYKYVILITPKKPDLFLGHGRNKMKVVKNFIKYLFVSESLFWQKNVSPSIQIFGDFLFWNTTPEGVLLSPCYIHKGTPEDFSFGRIYYALYGIPCLPKSQKFIRF